MILGLVRHFKVDFYPIKKIYSAGEFSAAMARYETSPILKNGLKFSTDDWDKCYCSTIPRAIETAEEIYDGEKIFTDLIVEVPVTPFTNRKIKLPSFIWHLGGRIAWYKNHPSQPESRIETLQRISQFIREVESCRNSRILVVTHGFFMRVFAEQLIKNGFKGNIDARPENGKLYLFNKSTG